MGGPRAAAMRVLLIVLVVCVHVCSSQQDRNSAQLQQERKVKVASDIACGMCGFVAEDLWSSLVRDWTADNKKGDLIRMRGPHRTTREMLDQLCADRSPIIGHFVDMYDIQQCSDNAQYPACRKPGRQWFLKRAGQPSPKSAADLEKEMNDDYQAALASVIGSVLKGDSSLAAALTAKLGGDSIIDPGLLSELMDAAMASDGELDAEEKSQFQTLVSGALEKRAVMRMSKQAPSPPRVKTVEEKVWHLNAYRDVCVNYLRGAEVEFTEAIGEQFTTHKETLDKLRDPKDASAKEFVLAGGSVEAVVSVGKEAVSTSSCADVCDDADKKLMVRRKKNKSKSGRKKKAKDSKTGSKRSEL